jgi:ATP-dependent DNA helicase RecG
MLYLYDQLAGLPHVGPTYAKKLKVLGLETVRDLLFYFPFRYDDFSTVATSRTLEIDSKVTLEAALLQIENIFTRTGKKMTKALFQDAEGVISVVWFNQPYLTKSLKVGETIRLTGKITSFNSIPTLMAPKWERVTPGSGARTVHVADTVQASAHSGRLVPVYSESSGITSRWLRDRVSYILDALTEYPEDTIPQRLLTQRDLYGLKKSLQIIHFPPTLAEAQKAKHRFAYEELFLAQIKSTIARKKWKSSVLHFTLSIDTYRPQIESLIAGLPFQLTHAQHTVVEEILSDLSLQTPMNRLVEGDVGSGKTVVAAIAMYLVYLNGFKSVLMAPTQILAQQHYESLQRLLSPCGVSVVLVTSAVKKKDISDSGDIYVGTQALLFQKSLDNVALTVVDEQHRFGVAQRAQLRSKHGITHILSMTATPIPRTLALTMYGDLDLSVINEMPPGRKIIKTWVVPLEKRASSYAWITQFIREQHEQVFIVCPFIQQSESNDTVKAAVVEYEHLKKDVFPELRVGLLHGGMKNGEKDTVLQQFRDKDFEILVCTPVVEVGIDIPNASIILIESAERFGLAQLHQLRGRVGRGGQQAYCLLFTSDQATEDSSRLKALETTYSGIDLAEIDLKQRGVGNIFGYEQSGRTFFRFADFSDLSLIQAARADAQQIVAEDTDLQHYPALFERVRVESEYVEAN